MAPALVLATSLAPGKRLDRQRAALASWGACGFRAVSFNSAAEIALLRPAFPDLDFVVPPRTAEGVTGKPLVYVGDVLAWFRAGPERVGGIVNSDIVLDPPGDLAGLVRREALGSLIVSTRVEIDPTGDRPRRRNPWCFDLFFFDRVMIDLFVDCGFCLGMPYWDYWMPTTVALHGLPLKALRTDLAFHESHAEAWSDQRYLFGHRFVEFLLAEIDRSEASLGPGGDPRRDFLKGLVSVYYRKIHARLKNRDAENQGEAERFHVTAQYVEFCDALNETTFRYLHHRAQPLDLGG